MAIILYSLRKKNLPNIKYIDKEIKKEEKVWKKLNK